MGYIYYFLQSTADSAALSQLPPGRSAVTLALLPGLFETEPRAAEAKHCTDSIRYTGMVCSIIKHTNLFLSIFNWAA